MKNLGITLIALLVCGLFIEVQPVDAKVTRYLTGNAADVQPVLQDQLWILEVVVQMWMKRFNGCSIR